MSAATTGTIISKREDDIRNRGPAAQRPTSDDGQRTGESYAARRISSGRYWDWDSLLSSARESVSELAWESVMD
jgi:hypothetical protein